MMLSSSQLHARPCVAARQQQPRGIPSLRPIPHAARSRLVARVGSDPGIPSAGSRIQPTPGTPLVTGGGSGGGSSYGGGAGGSGGSGGGDNRLPNDGAGRGGPWWNDPTYWIGILLGVGLGVPLYNTFFKKSDKQKAEEHLDSARQHASAAAKETAKAGKETAKAGQLAASDAKAKLSGDHHKNSIKSAASSVKGAVKHAAAEAEDAVEEAGHKAGHALSAVKHKTVDPVGHAASSAAHSVSHAAGSAKDAIVGKAEDVKDAAYNAGVDTKKGAKKAAIRAETATEEGKAKSRGWLARVFGRGRVSRALLASGYMHDQHHSERLSVKPGTAGFRGVVW
eukprot:GHRQ01022186.1.p1 GENE.GHRQ01022186.1~~GHRQ01022186.1.p1  ORF type:complete len:338 (-),score=135.36 GHRQ01022186.1:234-1247(-)